MAALRALFVPPAPCGATTGLAPFSTSQRLTRSVKSVRLAPRKRTRRSPISCAATPPAAAAAAAATSASASLRALLNPADAMRYVFFGGKGGVGKTSTACAAAVKMADEGFRVLLISTDPAHSVGDALGVELSGGAMTRIELDGSPGSLFAIESDTSAAVAEFRALVAALTGSDTGETGSGPWRALADKIKLADFADVLDTVPPGADELIALVRVLELADGDTFQRVIIDTAPTGHTLRLLAFPDFLDKFLTKALALRARLDSARGVISGLAGVFLKDQGVDKRSLGDAMSEAAKRVELYRDRMIALSDLFRDPSRSEFVVVSIPTVLAVSESARLIDRLWDDGIWTRHIVANQVLPWGNEAALQPYLKRLRKGQASQIAFATEQLADEYGLVVSTVPLFDTEVRGVYGLRALAAIAFAESRIKSYGELFLPSQTRNTVLVGQDKDSNSQFVFVGGKGGVGKTSISAAMGVGLAQRGLKTLILSTDPAHSLADALDMPLEGGAPVSVPDTDDFLYAMEIDTAAAVADFQKLVSDFASDDSRRGLGADITRNLGLDDFAELLDNAPPGIDELVALTQVIDLVKYGDFDRVVVDTAPTGHTLRLLSFPDFLNNFLGKIVRLKQRLDSALDALRGAFGRKDTVAAVDQAARRVERFRRNMTALGELIADENRTQFALVTIPTVLAMAESERLVKSLKNDGVYTRNLVINQVVPDSSAAAFVGRIAKAQDDCLRQLADAGKDRNIHVTKVPYFDVEVRGIYGLRAMGAELFREGE